MKRNSLLFATALLIGLTGCKNTPAPQEAWMSNALDAAFTTGPAVSFPAAFGMLTK